MDQTRDGLVTVLVTRVVARHRLDLARLFPYPDHLQVALAAHPYIELEHATDRIRDNVAGLQDLGVMVTQFGPNVKDNAVNVGVLGDIAKAQRALQSLLPGAPVQLQQVGYAKTAGQKPLDAPPLRGGQWIESSQYDCTS